MVCAEDVFDPAAAGLNLTARAGLGLTARLDRGCSGGGLDDRLPAAFGGIRANGSPRKSESSVIPTRVHGINSAISGPKCVNAQVAGQNGLAELIAADSGLHVDSAQDNMHMPPTIPSNLIVLMELPTMHTNRSHWLHVGTRRGDFARWRDCAHFVVHSVPKTTSLIGEIAARPTRMHLTSLVGEIMRGLPAADIARWRDSVWAAGSRHRSLAR
jgi:hypothetical protein